MPKTCIGRVRAESRHVSLLQQWICQTVGVIIFKLQTLTPQNHSGPIKLLGRLWFLSTVILSIFYTTVRSSRERKPTLQSQEAFCLRGVPEVSLIRIEVSISERKWLQLCLEEQGLSKRSRVCISLNHRDKESTWIRLLKEHCEQ